MARTFPGGGNTDNLAATISAYDSGPWTMFAWHTSSGGTGGSNGRIVHIGTGTSGQLFYWSAETSLRIEQGFSVAQQHAASYSRAGNSNWEFTVLGYDGSTSAPDDDGGTSFDQMFAYVGDVDSSMTQVDTGSGESNASGSRTTGLTDLRIGNRQNGLNRVWNGKIFCVGMVPYMMDIATAEELRQGNMSVLLDFDPPIFLFGLEGSDLVSAEQFDAGYGPDLTLTATGTSTDTDPITLDWSGGAVDDEATPALIAVSSTVNSPTLISRTLPSAIAVSTTIYAPTDLIRGFPSVVAVSSTVNAATVKSIATPTQIAVNTTVGGVEVTAITPQRRLRARPLRTVGHSAYLS